jgi:hypothetical protein
VNASYRAGAVKAQQLFALFASAWVQNEPRYAAYGPKAIAAGITGA